MTYDPRSRRIALGTLQGAMVLCMIAGVAVLYKSGGLGVLMIIVGLLGSVYASSRRDQIPVPPPAPAVRPVASPKPPTPAARWRAAVATLDEVAAQYSAFETDARRVLRAPALADVAVPSTARFLDAFAEATALRTDQPPPAAMAERFVAAAAAADRAWRAAESAAERIGHSQLAPEERAAVQRVLKLLTTARDSDSEPERLAAYQLARDHLARLDRTGVVKMPKAALERPAIEPPQ